MIGYNVSILAYDNRRRPNPILRQIQLPSPGSIVRHTYSRTDKQQNYDET